MITFALVINALCLLAVYSLLGFILLAALDNTQRYYRHTDTIDTHGKVLLALLLWPVLILFWEIRRHG